MRKREERIRRAVERTARAGAKIAGERVPKAFESLLMSLESGPLPDGQGYRYGSSAPHADATERGTRPHFPPIEPLIRWVKLRGMEGLSGKSASARAKGVAALIRRSERGGAVSVDTPERIAYAIQQKIGREGTKPLLWAKNSIPPTMEILDREIIAALPDED